MNFLFLLFAIILCSFSTVFAFNLFSSHIPNTKHKRHVWPRDAQNQAPVSQVQPNAVQQVSPLMGNTYCDPTAIGKRSVHPLDSFPNLNNFYLNEETSDVTLVVNGTKLPAHRFVLMAKSPKFAEMFRSEPTKTEFDLGLDSENYFKILLKYFYTEMFHMEDNNDYQKAIEVYRLAEQYGADALKLQIERSLAKMIFPTNYIDILKFAEENQMHELARLWMTFVFANSQQIITDESYMNETVDIAEKVLGTLNAPPSYVLVQIKKLMAANPQLDAQHFRNIVHIERCSIEDLLTLAEMKLYDERYLFEDMIKRFRVLAANCNAIAGLNVRHVAPRWVPN